MGKRRLSWLLLLLLLGSGFAGEIRANQLFASSVMLKAQDKEVPEEETQEEKADKQQKEEGSRLQIGAPSAVLMEASTGQVLYEKESKQMRAPASVTKIMTLLLIFDALKGKKISLADTVTVSEYAASMGGSQVFLEAGESQTVETMLKCIAVASANDACVAMAEYIWGSEDEFVAKMNQRARGLHMDHTFFQNCNGLDCEGHETTAYDIALMSRELLGSYPEVQKYTKIWMENITHTTSRGTTEFGLVNTNKLLRQYEYTTGLKTGSTDQAKFCVSASARKNDIDLIAVIMGASDPKERFQDAVTLLNHGFSKCVKYEDKEVHEYQGIPVRSGTKETLCAKAKANFSYIDTKGEELSQIKSQPLFHEGVSAPVKQGEVIGVLEYFLKGEKIGSVDIVAEEAVSRLNYGYACLKVAMSLLL